MSTPTIKFYYRGTKRPKLLEDDVFVLYSPQKLKFQPGEKKMVDMKIKIEFSPNTTGNCRLLFGLSNRGLCLLNSACLTGETNLHFEILNSNLTQTLQINNRHEIGYFTPNHTGRKIKYKYVKEYD